METTIIWAGDPYGISSLRGLGIMLERIGSRVIKMGTRTIPYIGPTYDYLATYKDQTIGGGIMVSFYGGNFDVWVTPADVAQGPFGSALLADVFVDPGTDWRLWYSVRTTPWPPRTQ